MGMMTVVFNEKSYEIKTGWHEVAFKDYLNACQYLDATDYESTQYLFMCQIIGLPYEILREMHGKQVHELLKACDWVFNLPKAEKMVNEFSFQGIKWTANPNFFQVKGGQFVDACAFVQRYEGLKCIPYVTAVLFWKESDKGYNEDVVPDFEARVNTFQNIPMTIVVGIHLFFLSLSSVLNSDFKPSLETMTGMKKAKFKSSFRSVTVGCLRYIIWRMTTFTTWIRSKICRLLKYCSF